MNIVYHHRIASKDGQFVHIEEIITALEKQGHTVHLVGPELHAKADFGHDGGLISRLKKKLPKAMYEVLELGYSALAGYRLWKAVKQHKPDVIYERYNLFQPAGIVVSKLTKIPLILEVNAPLKEERSKFAGGIALPWLADWSERFTWRNADVVLPVTKVLSQYCLNAGVSPEKIDVVHNGIKQDVYEQYSEKDTETQDAITIGFTGFMHLTCGLDMAIEALAESNNKNAKLVCVGDGDIVPSLKEKAASLGVSERVEFTGLVTRDKIMDYVSKFDIALQPDVTSYASPLKMFEYMAMKCLIVAPDSDNIKEILDEDSAVFFTLGSKEAFKSALRGAIDDTANLSKKRQRAFEIVKEKGFIWEMNSQRIVDHATRLNK